MKKLKELKTKKKMRHLKKFNENTESGLDIEYIKHCFADLIDMGADFEEEDHECTPSWKSHYGNTSVNIEIEEPKIKSESTIQEYKSGRDEQLKLISKFESGIQNLKDEYPSYSFEFYIKEMGENNAWVNTIERKLQLRIYETPKKI